MNLFKRVYQKISKQYNKKRFDQVADKVRTSLPVNIQHQDDIVIVSQVYHAAMDMSLLALKSFAKFFTRGRFELIDDGSLTEDDYRLLKHHLPNVNITKNQEIEVGQCPRGGCWERLIHIINLSKNAYVIQVDTDTLTVGPLPEVDAFVRNNQAFTIGNPMWPAPTDSSYMSAVAKAWQGTHVQVKTEEQLASLKSIQLERYLRGCAAFTGFPKGVLNFNVLEALSLELESKLGKDKWHEWGSEQVTSNIMVSLCDDAQILPWPKYMNYGFPNTGFNNVADYAGKVSLLHFIGSNRYDHRVYEKLVKLFVK
ncbi:MAG: hypothetical protein ACSHW0_18355 [Thalassotalea sp.]